MTRIGIIEGFFGAPWSWSERHAALPFMQQHGFDSYLYAPKADQYLRASWKRQHRPDDAKALAKFA